MKLSGAQIVIECLLEQNIDTVFGYPGGNVLEIYDALYHSPIKHILTASEQGAGFCADGYSRASGKVGVCIATSGPGATNLVTSIATAYMDSIPVIYITGNVSTDLIGKDAFQEADITGITNPITKHNYFVNDIEELADIIREAFYIATSGRQGPVLIDIPKDVSMDWCEYNAKTQVFTDKLLLATKEDIDTLIALIQNSKEPLLFVGAGVAKSNASEELNIFAKKINAPVVSTFMGLGVTDSQYPLYMGMTGMYGLPAANKLIYECDLLIAIGCRLSDRVIGKGKAFKNRNIKLVHIDIDPAEINKSIVSYHSILADAKDALTKLINAVSAKENNVWIQKCQCDLNSCLPPLKNAKGLNPILLVKKVREIMGADAIIVTDVGQHQMFVAQNYSFEKPRKLISNGGYGAMAFGLGAAIGAKLALPHQNVVLFVGDGGFRMSFNELATLKNYNINLTIILFNNGTLGMIRQWQAGEYKKRYSESTLANNIDYLTLAKAFGIKGYCPKNLDEFSDILYSKNNETILIDCKIDIDANVLCNYSKEK